MRGKKRKGRDMAENKAGASAAKDTSDREVVLSRVFDAPRELVWNAWTDPKQVVRWWGPKGFTTTTYEMDVRPGGLWRLTMHGPDGTDYPNEVRFIEVVKPERIIYSMVGGKKGETAHQVEATWTFEALSEAQTRLTLRMVFPSAAVRDHVERTHHVVEGGTQTLARLGEYLENTDVKKNRTTL